MAELDQRWHIPASPGSLETKCGQRFGGATPNDVDIWMEHSHPGSCTECMRRLDQSVRQYKRPGDAFKESAAVAAPEPAPTPPTEPAATQVAASEPDEDAEDEESGF